MHAECESSILSDSTNIMVNIFFISDTHFDHAASLTWLGHDGVTRQRPFATTQECDELIIANWNAKVRPQDKVYHLGDVSMKKSAIATMGRLNGHKRLVRGNHDIHPTKCYLPYFEDIYGVRVFDDMVLSHMPLHPESVKQRWLVNVHGHVHGNVPALHFGPHYLNVSVEVTGFAPLAIEEVRQMARAQQEM